MKKNGFTLIEIIGVIVILGIIAIIAFATYTSSLTGFRDSYYVEQVRTLEKSAKEFFDDNRNYRPSKILNAQEVPITTLQSKKYVNSIVDYDGNSCDDTSYVLVVKEGKDDYSYHVCLICDDDGYDNTQDNLYCDKSWLDPTKVEYGLGVLSDIYIYKGTSRDELKEALELPVSYIRKNNEDEVLAIRQGTKDGDPTLIPIDIDTVNTEIEDVYNVTYKYGMEEAQRKVIVYENTAPTIEYKKENVVATSLSGVTSVERKDYNSGEWAQNVIVILKSNEYTEPGVSTSRFQWNVDGKWQDFCNEDPCEKKVTREMVQTLQFRIVDSNGKISKITEPVTFKIDNTKPKCELTIPTAKGDNDWYKTDVTIQFINENTFDRKGEANNQNFVSGIKYRNVQISNAVLGRFQTTSSNVHNIDGSSITYIGYVEDEAENFNTCSITFKRDATPPQCGYTLRGTIKNNGWYVTNVEVEITTHTDNLSGVASNGTAYGTGSITGSKKFNHTQDISSVQYTGHIKDNAGNTNTCQTVVFKKDSTPPDCGSWSGESTSWTASNRSISVGCSDGMSTCDKSSYTDTTSSGTTTTKSISLVISDKAGNTRTCTKTASVYVDKDSPTCGSISYSNSTTSNVTVSVGCSDSGSLCSQGSFSKANQTRNGSIRITDGVGNYRDCSYTVYTQKQKRTASCKTYNERTNKACGTYNCNCSDCHTGSNTCAYGCNTCSKTERECTYLDDLSGGGGRYDCRNVTKYYACNCSSCHTGSNTCAYGCDKCNNTCRLEQFGCEVWNSWSGWSDDSGCSANTGNSSRTECQDVYRAR